MDVDVVAFATEKALTNPIKTLYKSITQYRQ